MIEWKVLNPFTAAQELPEEEYLILCNGRAVQAEFDAANQWFVYKGDGADTIYWSKVTHYAKINFP